MRKVLKYKILPTASQNIMVQITEQSRRENAFGTCSNVFKVNNDIQLVSRNYPAYDPFYKTSIYVRGSNSDKDDYVIVLPKDIFDAFEFTVKNYNETEFINYNETELKKYIPIKEVQQAQDNIERYVRDGIENIQEILNNTKSITCVDTLMEWKKNLMHDIIKLIPMYSEHCAFCIHGRATQRYNVDNDWICNDCYYRQKKGKCNEPDSTYKKIYDNIGKLLDEIHNYY